MQTRPLPFRILLKTGLLAGTVVISLVYTGIVWEDMGYPVRGALKGLSLLLVVALGGWMLWRLVHPPGFRPGGYGPAGPKVRQPRPPGGRPPALSAAAHAEEDRG